ncbi:ATP synthase subunit E [Clostridium tetani]|uniref:V-type proton ATPase subunit E n=1 Tax=Clostridium tetani TaxID=1513 RepID=A0ABY0EPL3_CLOTA|nr:V-type ATP synthase subunit E family protein [Clostridium tetani]KHO39619.1 ATP synthase subunit E [Clostridium tetani]RXI38617.1 V-type ATP synthase subunit E [Clostridium tetani]RXI55423.1 V-type ATP synthase subunit E [Clostridium tetani]RXI68494.1 V-type ATP synthase subunit E [Clostridium tetani]
MSRLENLTSKIIKDSEKKAKIILDEAKREEEKIMLGQKQEGESVKSKIIEKAYLESKNRKERIISNSHLFVRNRKLEAKQEVIDKVYKETLNKLAKLSKEEYLNFIKDSILALEIYGDEEIILSQDEKYINKETIEAINKELKSKGKKGEIKISDKKRGFRGGFILNKDGIEINNTFEALILSLKDDLEPVIIDTLFS